MIVGTAGHIDHGKTALIKALTGTDPDRLAEEKARGITIDLGFAYADLGGGTITGFVDVPGHERLLHTMLAGAGGIDFALLVVAANDGIMPQTCEHLAVLDLLGITRGVVALTKIDLVDPQRRTEVTARIRTTLAGTGLGTAPIIPVSAQSGEGIPALRSALAEAESESTARDHAGLLRFSVDRSFTLPGAGTVVTGMMLSGQVRLDDVVTVSPSGLTARVRGIHAQNRKATEGLAGQRCALNLAGDRVTKDALRRGDIVLSPPLHAPSDRIDAVLCVLASETKAIGTWFPARLHSHAAEVGARVVPLDGPVSPGGEGFVQLVLDRPVAAAIGDRFILRDTSASRTIGGGRFLDLRPPARKRGTPERLACLSAARSTEPAVALSGLAAIAPVDLAVFLRDRGLAESAQPGILDAANAETVGAFALSSKALGRLQADLVEHLAAFHADNPDLAGIGRERLRLALPLRLPKDTFLTFLKTEAAAGCVVLDGAFLRLPGHAARLSAADEGLWDRVKPHLLGEGRFRPPRVRDFAESFGMDERAVRRMLKLTQKLGRTDQIAHDHFFAREVVKEMAAIVHGVAAQAEDGWFTAPAFRDRVHNGRKVAIEILDFFDRLGLTLRKGDLRRINPHRSDLFDL
ncbi:MULTISPECIES: selenocysteine-specific translation elongation factor [unclassified Shinella]|uniref:selenocysteine-specific translation elongation factor n=1 Tax=unclassified Shinella TaxID=2643062 RepID=UPI0003C530F2|nr:MULTISPECIES: selenocysteine-specific translation elongation factor [unclassified Shinella]EYR84543.1 selenocysteine-specific elongation factor SelB [Shinella sp. DD12]KNY14006.1 translation elongation factor [Shinella sp. SUS2]KOC73725.1 translation elongation factor [Shinella sp. GWS1]MCO5148957.1 selenocysteine-specific translation elongation factor [Shinella sp.]MDC7265015.1 selenocysteine-specific translation elongation factor [Shinella sp. HY16]